MKRKVILVFNSLLLYSWLQTAMAADEPILSEIWLNGLDQNKEALLLKEGELFYIECDVVKSLGLKVELFDKNSKQTQYCLISSKKIHANLDSALQAIKINVPAEYFDGYAQHDKLPLPTRAALGAFLNYDFYFDKYKDNHEFNNFYELGVFKDYWLFKNAVIYRDNPTQGKSLIRLNSQFLIDFPSHFSRLVVGDNTSVYNTLMSSFRFGGLSYGTNYTERPDFIYWNAPILKGSALVPSMIDLYVNGTSIYRQKVTPGDYNLQTGALIQQSGTAQIVVEDIFGNRSVQTFPVYVNNQLLKVGLNEYNFSLGKIRYNYDYNSSDYRDFFSSFYFRRGITQQTTLGVNGAYSRDIQNMGLMWTQAIGRYALVDFSAMGSHANSGNGYSIGASISQNFKRFSMGVSSKYASKQFQTLGYSDEVSIPKIDNLAYFSMYKIPFFDSINFNYLDRRYYPNQVNTLPNRKLLNVGLTKQISPRLSLSINYFKDFGDNPDTGAYFSLSYNFDQNKAVYVSQSTDSSTRVNFVRSSIEQNGFDYSLGVNRVGGQMDYNAYGLYKTSVGDFGIQHDQQKDYYDTQLSYKGALVWLNNQFSFTKSVDNAFALVKVGDYKDIDVFRSLSPVGKTGENGYFFVHNIIPYVTYDVSFDQDQIPIEDKINTANQKLIALNQRGYFLNYPIFHTQQRVVKLVDAQQKTFERGTEVYINDHEDEPYPIDKDGLVYLYGLVPNHYTLSIKKDGKVFCRSDFNVSATSADTSQDQQTVTSVCQ